MLSALVCIALLAGAGAAVAPRHRSKTAALHEMLDTAMPPKEAEGTGNKHVARTHSVRTAATAAVVIPPVGFFRNPDR